MRNNYKTILLLVLILTIISLACKLTQSAPNPATPTTNIYATAITAGGTHACALLNNGKIMCWGSNSSGQLGLGDGTYKNHTASVLVQGLTDVIAISAGGEHTCAIIKNGSLKCWGNNISGQLGDGTKITSEIPVDVTGLTSGVIVLSAGGEHTCAITNEGKAMCWGKNLYGRGGNGSNTRLVPIPTEVIDLSSGTTIISAGFEHTCAITDNNTLKCWGSNSSGELGIGRDDKNLSNVPLDVINLSEVTSVSAGF